MEFVLFGQFILLPSRIFQSLIASIRRTFQHVCLNESFLCTSFSNFPQLYISNRLPVLPMYFSLMASRGCKNSPNSFCYICGEYTTKKYQRTLTDKVKKLYKLYFQCSVGEQDKSWAPHVCCVKCSSGLYSWFKSGQGLPFGIPMIWREQRDHLSDCYFCAFSLTGIQARGKKNLPYPSLDSAIRPVAHSHELPIPMPPPFLSDSSSQSSSISDAEDLSYEPADLPSAPHIITQSELNDLVRDLNLTKSQGELLASRLQGWHLLDANAKVTFFRKRTVTLENFFSKSGDLCYCNDISALFSHFDRDYDKQEWRLFIDASKTSIKAVLLHNGNVYPSIPLAYSVTMKENYENMKEILRCIRYDENQWAICADFKVIAILTGLQLGYTKYCCFLCLWDSRDRTHHYQRKDWPLRNVTLPGNSNIIHQPLVDRQSVILPPLHIKLGLMKQLVKALEKECVAFKYLGKKFPALSMAKIKEGVFVGPQIRDLLNDNQFEETMDDHQLAAWRAFKAVCQGFLGNLRAPNYIELVQQLLHSYEALGCNMSLKLHFLMSHIDFFPENMGNVSDEHGERFHQDIAIMEKRYKGKLSSAMLADYCWMLQRDAPDVCYKRASSSKHF